MGIIKGHYKDQNAAKKWVQILRLFFTIILFEYFIGVIVYGRHKRVAKEEDLLHEAFSMCKQEGGGIHKAA